MAYATYRNERWQRQRLAKGWLQSQAMTTPELISTHMTSASTTVPDTRDTSVTGKLKFPALHFPAGT